MWVLHRNFHPKRAPWKVGGTNFTEKKSNTHYLNQLFEFCIHRSQVDHLFSRYDVMSRSVGFLLKTHNPSLITRKVSGKFQQRPYTTKELASSPQNCQGRQKQRKSEDFHSQEALKETWQLNVTWYPRWDSGTEIWHKVHLKLKSK